MGECYYIVKLPLVRGAHRNRKLVFRFDFFLSFAYHYYSVPDTHTSLLSPTRWFSRENMCAACLCRLPRDQAAHEPCARKWYLLFSESVFHADVGKDDRLLWTTRDTMRSMPGLKILNATIIIRMKIAKIAHARIAIHQNI